MYKNGSILSGFLIGFAGILNLMTSGGIIGATLFASGLIAVCLYGSYLYTGKAGCWEFRFLHLWEDLGGLTKVLGGNIIGTGLAAFLLITCLGEPKGLQEIIESRASSDFLGALGKGIGCGVLMEISVYGWRMHGSFLPILLCVPAFILSGMYHSIADSFYYLAGWKYLDFHLLVIWIMTVLGNFIGCNIRRLLC